MIGLFGGTFDPPHLGHLILAAECRYQLGLERLLWVLTPDPPHKAGLEISPVAMRLTLVQAAIAHDPGFELSRLDIDRLPPQYALDTVRLAQVQHPGQGIVYLMGGDSLHDLPSWHAPQQFVDACAAIGVMRRPGDQVDLSCLEKKLPGLQAKVRFVDAPLLEISSSEIRQRIAQGAPYRYYLPAAVYQVIETNGWYRQKMEP